MNRKLARLAGQLLTENAPELVARELLEMALEDDSEDECPEDDEDEETDFDDEDDISREVAIGNLTRDLEQANDRVTRAENDKERLRSHLSRVESREYELQQQCDALRKVAIETLGKFGIRLTRLTELPDALRGLHEKVTLGAPTKHELDQLRFIRDTQDKENVRLTELLRSNGIHPRTGQKCLPLAKETAVPAESQQKPLKPEHHDIPVMGKTLEVVVMPDTSTPASEPQVP